jgi:hypothetical protein
VITGHLRPLTVVLGPASSPEGMIEVEVVGRVGEDTVWPHHHGCSGGIGAESPVLPSNPTGCPEAIFILLKFRDIPGLFYLLWDRSWPSFSLIRILATFVFFRLGKETRKSQPCERDLSVRVVTSFQDLGLPSTSHISHSAPGTQLWQPGDTGWFSQLPGPVSWF